MRILLISNMYPTGSSIAGIFIKHQKQALEKAGISVIKRVLEKNAIKEYAKFYALTVWDLLHRKYDLVHAHYGFHSAIVPALLGIHPLVVTFHGSDALVEPFRNRFFLRLQKYVVHKAERIIAVSNDLKEKISDNLEGDVNKISVISCGVDTNVFKPDAKSAARERLNLNVEHDIALFVGKINYWKGVDLIYAAAEKLPGITFVMIGNGDYKCKLKNCVFPGPVANEDIPTWLNAADIFLLPSRTEGTPVVILEAMACGLPVISSPVGGCRDLVKSGDNGYLLDFGELSPDFKSKGVKKSANESKAVERVAAELTGKIRTLFDNAELRTAMGIKARIRATTQYDHAVVARKIKRIYSELIQSSG